MLDVPSMDNYEYLFVDGLGNAATYNSVNSGNSSDSIISGDGHRTGPRQGRRSNLSWLKINKAESVHSTSAKAK